MNYEVAKKLKDTGFPQYLDLNPALSYEDSIESEPRMLAQCIQGTGIHLMYDSSRGETIEELRSKPVEEWDGKGRPSYYFKREYIESSEGQELLVYRPTLEELITVIDGDRQSFCYLFPPRSWQDQDPNKGNGKWKAGGTRPNSSDILHGYGDNAIEAMANLFIEINK